ncbi:6-bladed beta-propeller [Prevotella sp.]
MACKQTPANSKEFHVDNYGYKNWSTLLNIKDVIQLQENTNCLMSYAAKCIVLDSTIIYQDYKAKRIYSFSSDGKYLCTIGKMGHAASEYTSIKDICINKKDSVMMVLDDRGLVCYNLYDGKFKERKKFFSQNSNEYEKAEFVGNSEFICFTDNRNDNTIVYDSQKEVKGLRKGKRFHFVLNPFYKYNEECRVLSDYGDFYIDNYKDGRLETLYKIDFGKNALPADVLPKTYKDFEVVDNSTDYFKCIVEAHETSNWLYLKVVGPKQEYYIGFFNKKKGSYAFGQDDGKLGMFVIGAKEDNFYAIIYPEFVSPKSFANEILKKYGIDGSKNTPIIVKFCLNEKAL